MEGGRRGGYGDAWSRIGKGRKGLLSSSFFFFGRDKKCEL